MNSQGLSLRPLPYQPPGTLSLLLPFALLAVTVWVPLLLTSPDTLHAKLAFALQASRYPPSLAPFALLAVTPYMLNLPKPSTAHQNMELMKYLLASTLHAVYLVFFSMVYGLGSGLFGLVVYLVEGLFGREDVFVLSLIHI